eukprot:scaffold64758_cov31-Tisochrysis_lutea.AAC.4
MHPQEVSPRKCSWPVLTAEVRRWTKKKPSEATKKMIRKIPTKIVADVAYTFSGFVSMSASAKLVPSQVKEDSSRSTLRGVYAAKERVRVAGVLLSASRSHRKNLYLDSPKAHWAPS